MKQNNSKFFTSRRAVLLAIGALACVAPACVSEDDEPTEDVGDDSEAALTQTKTFQNGVAPSASYAGTTDTTLQESTPTTAAGSGTSIQADHDFPTSSGKSLNGLLRFDLSSIPTSAKVTAVSLTVNVSNPTSGAGYSVFEATKAWNEAQATWGAAAAGSAWAAGGARGAADRGTTILGTLLPTATGKYTLQLNAAGIAAVQAWIAQPSKNVGFAIDAVTNMDGLTFDSSEAPTVGNRPALAVTYSTASAGTGTGLLADYYTGTSFGSKVLSRTDATVNFDWGTAAPAANVPADNYSVRWSGQVQPLYDETYSFYTTTDDGVRLTVNGVKLIDNWTQHSATENVGTIALKAGTKYTILLEYYEGGGDAVAKLAWSSPSQAKGIIPASQLYSGTTTTPTPDAGTPDTSTPTPPVTPTSPAGYGAGSAPVGTACVNPKVHVNPSMTTAAIQAAINGAGANSLVCFDAGTYRLTGKLAAQTGQKLHGAPGAILKGSVVLTGAIASGSNYAFSNVAFVQASVDTHAKGWCEDLVTYPCAYYEDVFLNGKPLQRVTSLAAVKAGTFFNDYAAKKVYLGSNPAGQTVEIGRTKFAFEIGANNVTIEGFIVEQFAQGMDGAAIVFGTGTGQVIQNVESRYNHASGAVSFATGTIFRNNRFHDNGQTGASASNDVGVTMDHNDFIHNNIFGFMKNDAAEGGLKIDLLSGAVITNNYVANNLSFGIYFDENADNALIDHNYVEGNWAAGINYVFNRTAKITNNTVLDNGNDYVNGRGGAQCTDQTNIACLNAGIHIVNSSDVEISGNFVKDNANGIALAEYTRSQAGLSWTVPDTKNAYVHDNTVYVGSHSSGMRQYGGPAGYNITTSNNRFQHNTYHLVSLTNPYFWFNSLKTRDQWKALGQDTTSTFLTP